MEGAAAAGESPTHLPLCHRSLPLLPHARLWADGPLQWNVDNALALPWPDNVQGLAELVLDKGNPAQLNLQRWVAVRDSADAEFERHLRVSVVRERRQNFAVRKIAQR